MANDRFDLAIAREGSDGKTYWTNIGKAFPNRNGGGYSLVFNALPLTNKGWRVPRHDVPGEG